MPSPALQLFETYQGGIIVYFLQPGDPGYTAPDTNGLIVYPQLLGTAQWGCYGTQLDVFGTALGTGSTNTASIVAGCTQDGTAAKICSDLNVGGYSDWYLPSQNELNEVYLVRSSLSFLNTSAGYWSSSETAVDVNFTVLNTAYAQLFGQPSNSQVSTSKSNPYYVIAMRSF